MKFTPVRPAKICFVNEATPVSCDFADVYFSREGLQESRHVFLEGNRLIDRFATHQAHCLRVAETGFGSGRNFLLLCQAFCQFRQRQPHARLQQLHLISFEQYPLTVEDLQRTHQQWQELERWAQQLRQQWDPLPGCHRLLLDQGQIMLDLWFGDINDSLPQLAPCWHQQIDAWFLDGFAPAKNPGMWSQTLFSAMSLLTRSGGTAATYSVAGLVRRGLQQAGFITEKRPGCGQKREMLTAYLPQARNCQHPQPWYWRTAASMANASQQYSNDIAIIGGGIASALLALALLRRGQQVTLYCADTQPARGASGNRQGALYPLITPHDLLLTRYFLSAFGFARRLFDGLPVAFDHQWCGVTQLAYDHHSARKITEILSLPLPASLLHALSPSQITQSCGLPVTHSGITYPAGGWLNPAQLTCALITMAERQGMISHYQQQAQRLHYLPHALVSALASTPASTSASTPASTSASTAGWQIHFANGNCRQHQVVVIANGWQLGQFSQTAPLPITSMAGQVSHIPTTEQLMRLRQVLCYDGYLTPRNPADNYHCLGSTHHRHNDHACYRKQDQQHNRQRLIDCLAGQSWTQQADISAGKAGYAVRCTIRDHLPLAGNVPDYAATLAQYRQLVKSAANPATVSPAPYYPDLFILAAFGSRGLCSAPLAAEILAAQICAEPLPLASDLLNALNPNRLWIRKLIRGRKL